MPTKDEILRGGDAAIGSALILVFLSASFMADLYGVSAVMDNQLSIWNQCLIAGGCVMVKACGLIKTRSAWRDGFWPSAIAMGFLTVMALVVSITNEMTYYNTNYSGKSARLAGDVTVSMDTAKEKSEIEDRLAKAGSLRPRGTIEGEITEALASPVKGDRAERSLGMLTKNCTAAKSPHYDQCRDVLSLRSELANAIELAPQVEKDQARLEVIRASKAWVTTIGEVNPGAGFWVRSYNRFVDWKGWGKEHYITNQDGQDALVVVLMLVLQSLNLFLPFAWFYKKADSVAVKKAIAGLVDRASDMPLAVEKISNDNARIETKKAVKRLEAAATEISVAKPKPIALLKNNDIKGFADRCCVFNPGFAVHQGDAYAAYLQAIGDKNPLSSKAFRQQLMLLPEALGVTEFTGSTGQKSYKGFKLTPVGLQLLGNDPMITAADAVKDRFADAA
ncbi:hypothetical protein [Hyphomicrobium sp.]|uniref:hypothetical protein n=1 Tax=Hyphomicrobium sp. TaxID=82 RepID=UPI001E024C30|nr:hypothetical protein [Hyphomicrobium sp.]MBY0561460.1 hypothetical protein [Hyphomicrobium sp.]